MAIDRSSLQALKAKPVLPTEDLVRSACKEFAADDIADRALKELFTCYPKNDNAVHILLKVVILNRLYSTNIFAVYEVAANIHRHGQELDAAIAEGAPEAVDSIARVTLRSGKQRGVWSFATKYCSWHNQAAYPIWDSRVCRYIRSLNEHLRSIGKAPLADPENWTNYQQFRELIDSFRSRYQLESFSFKEIDVFLWKYGEQPPTKEKAPAATEAADQP